MRLLDRTLAAIEPPDERASAAVIARLNSLTKPPGSLGRLEEIVQHYAAIRHDSMARWQKGAIAVFVADHGVADAGVSAYPKTVTVQMLRNFGAGGAAISVLARHLGFALSVFDVGVATDTSSEPVAGVTYRRIGPGTGNIVREAAMSLEQARQALEVGIEAARDAAADGATTLGIGEMGIGNSTPAAALLSVITGLPPASVAGRGTGLDDAQFRHKLEVIGRAIVLHRSALDDPVSRLAALGGFEIAAMAGACIGGAAHRLPVVVDGFIATAAAAVACELRPTLRDYLFFAHRSSEGGHALVLRHLDTRPLLDLSMRLGEGTGAALAMAIIRSALALFHQMATFAGAGVSEKIK